MSEIQHLTLPGTPLNPMPSHTTESLGQRFGQLLAQLSPEDQAWATAAELLAQSQHTNEAGESQAYVSEGVLTEVGKAHIQAAQARLQQQTGATEVSIEQGAKQLLVEALTTQYALEDNPAILQRAQTLQTELSAELTPQPDTPPAEVQSQPSINDLETYLAGQLQSLGHSSREAFEASQVDLGSGEVPVSALLATESEPRGQLKLLISIAAQQLQIQQAQAAQLERAEPPATPVVKPVKVPKGPLVKLVPGELYEFEVGEGNQQNLLDTIMRSFTLYANETYYGSTYHLKLLNADGDVIPMAPVIGSPSSVASEVLTPSNSDGDYLSVYWHGPLAANESGITNSAEGGTLYTMGGDITQTEQSALPMHLKVDLPLFVVDTADGRQVMRLDQIPFDKVQISQENSTLYKLPTQLDIDEARIALATPQNLTLAQLLEYTSPAIKRADPSLEAAINTAIEPQNIQHAIDNVFTSANNTTQEGVATTASRLTTFLIKNRRGFSEIGNIETVFKPNISQAKANELGRLRLQEFVDELSTRAPGRNFSNIDLDEQGRVNLTNQNLSNLDLSGMHLSHFNMTGVDLSGSNLQNTQLLNVVLDEATLNNTQLQNTLFHKSSLKKADLSTNDLTKTKFIEVNFKQANLSEANLQGVNLSKNIKLVEADLSKAKLQNVDFQQADLTRANLQKANLDHAKLLYADFNSADIRGTSLTGVTFAVVNVSGLIADPDTIRKDEYLKKALVPEFIIQEHFSSAHINAATTFAELDKLRGQVSSIYSKLSAPDKKIIDTELRPKLNQRRMEILFLGDSAYRHTFKSKDFSHRDMTSLQLAGGSFLDSDFSHANMQGLDLRDTTLQGSHISGAQLQNTNLHAANLNSIKAINVQLQGANLAGADLGYTQAIGAQLQGANLEAANLRRTNLWQANLAGAKTSNAVFSNIDLSQTNLNDLQYNQATRWNNVIITVAQAKSMYLNTSAHQDINFSTLTDDTLLVLTGFGDQPKITIKDQSSYVYEIPKALKVSEHLPDIMGSENATHKAISGKYDFEAGDFSNADLSGSNLEESDLRNTTLHKVNLLNSFVRQANFEQADLTGARLENTKVDYSNFKASNLTSAILFKARARGANFQDATLVNSNLMQANLGGANLANANLQGANLTDADLRSVNATSANFKGANLNGVDLRQTNLSNIQHDQTTQWQGTQLTAEQIQTLNLSSNQLVANTPPNEPSTIAPEQTPNLPTDSNTPNSLQSDTFNRGGSQNDPQDSITGFNLNNTLKPFTNPNGLMGDNGSQANHGDGNNNGGTITAVAGDPEEPNKPFQVINGQVNVSGVSLPELSLSGNVAQPGQSVFGIPVGLSGLPTYTPTPRTEASTETSIPAADTSSETVSKTADQASQQQGGVTVGGDLGNDKGRTAAELGLDPSGKLPGPEKAKAPDPIPGYGEGANTQDLNQTNTRDWGGGPVTPDQAKLTPGGFPQKDKTLDDILNPEGPSGARFRFPPGNEEIPAAEYQAVIKTLPALQRISVAEYSQLSSADQKNIISRAVEYQSLPADIKANTSLLQYADSRQTSPSQRIQMLGEQQRQNVHTTQQILSSAQSGLSDSTVQLIDVRIEALQVSAAALNQQTQVLTQNNANRQSTLETPTTADPVTAAFIKPDIKPDQTPPASNSIATPQLNSQASPIPRFMVIRTANGPQLMENLPNGKTQILPYPVPADTQITRQNSNGGWRNVPDAYAIGAKNLLDTLLLQSTVKMLNGGNAVQAPGAQNAAPQAPASFPQPAF